MAAVNQNCMQHGRAALREKVSTFLSKFVDVASKMMQGSAPKEKLSCRSNPEMGRQLIRVLGVGCWMSVWRNVKILLRLCRSSEMGLLTGCHGLPWKREQVLRTSGYSELKRNTL